MHRFLHPARPTDGGPRHAPTRRRCLALLAASAIAAATATPTQAAAFDHRHAAWDALLKQTVVVAPSGHASTLRYAEVQSRRAALQGYLDALSAVTMGDYRSWTASQRLAFLINAYNAQTVALVLTRYPDLRSIKELGSLVRSPWKRKFFQLLGEERSLDEVEHEMVRAPGVFDDARIHMAMVCASIGCPMLRNEAFVAERLDAQLDDSMRRFLSDRSRNRYDAESATLTVSKIFDWYRKDFERPGSRIPSLNALFARHADALATSPAARDAVRAGRYTLAYADYDWTLNDAR